MNAGDLPSRALQLVEDPRPCSGPASSNVVQLVEERKARKGTGVRTPRKAGVRASVEHKARAVWEPGISVEALQVAAGISRGSAMKYHAKLSAEDDATRVELAQ